MKFIILFLFLIININSQTYFINQDSLSSITSAFEFWKYSDLDSLRFKEQNYDDSDWEIIKSRFRLSKNEINWNGDAWFRASVKIDSALINKPLGINLWHPGKSEIYLNGKLLYNVDQESNDERTFIQFPIPVYFNSIENTIAIRYENNFANKIEQYGYYSGFYFKIGNYLELLKNKAPVLISLDDKKIIFISIGFVLLLIHLSLYFFNKSFIQNLFYSFFLISFVGFIFNNYTYISKIPLTNYISIRSFGMFPLLLTILFGSATIHSFYKKIDYKFFYSLLAAGLLISSVRVFINSDFIWYVAYSYIILVSIWGSNYLYNRKRKKELGGDWILISGFASFGVLGFYQMVIALQIIENPIFGINDPFIYGILIFLLSMSISLSRDFAVTNKNLRRKLIEVKELSDKNIQQEIERKILAADNKRKTEELEDARNFQLSLLPKDLPKLDNVKVFAKMLTATEVGGDYFDYFIREKRLTLVVGDATGHGTKAGNMVVAIKSLFSTLNNDNDQVSFFNKCNYIIKNMHLDKIYMSLSLVNIEGNDVSISSAGMPQSLYFNSAKNEVEEILLKGMPIGAVNNFPYSIKNFKANKNDLLFLFTDGIIEQFNEAKEQFGLEKVKEILKNSSDKNPELIFEDLLEAVNLWKKDEPQNDDITFMIIKFV